MSTFSERTGSRPPNPARNIYEDAPQRLRGLLLEMMQEKWGNFEAYKRMCRLAGIVPDATIAGNARAHTDMIRLVDYIDWYDVFDLLEALGRGGAEDERVNRCFARCGLAYEMTMGTIDLYDPVGNALHLGDAEPEATALLVGDFESVREQYGKAISALHGRPADLEKAVAESLNALEAVARIASGRKDFGPAIDAVLAGRIDSGGLAASLKALYGWASQVPGVRHGRVDEPDLTFADARYAVRAVGVAIGYLIEGNAK